MKRKSLLRKTLLLFVFLCITGIIHTLSAQDFVHPGVLHKEADLARAREKIAEKAEPWYTAWNNLLAAPEAQLTWGSRATSIVYRGSGTPDNIALMYRDVAAAYEHALIYKINGDLAHAAKAAEILNSWANINTSVSGTTDACLALGLNGYQFAAAAELMRDYPGFDVAKFKKYLMTVFYPGNRNFLDYHNGAYLTNYRCNWDICNMNSILAIGVFCDDKTLFDYVINYCKTGGGTGGLSNAVCFTYPNLPTPGADIWGQWEESGRDQGHCVQGLILYGLFCEMAWNQNVDIYSYDNCRFRKGAEYVARYNILTDSAGVTVGKYNDLPYTSRRIQQGNPSVWTGYLIESVMGAGGRGKYGRAWETIFNHYSRRLNQGDKVQSIKEILQQQPSTATASAAIHPDTYDIAGVMALVSATDSGTYIPSWEYMDVSARSIALLPKYGTTTLKDGVMTVSGAGNGIKNSSDNFHYAFQKVIDEGSIIARVNSVDEVNTMCQSGIMFRNTQEQNSVNAFLSVTANSGAVFTVRDSIGKTTKTIASNTQFKTFPCWLQLSRSGNTVTASVSPDSLTWTTVGTANVKFNRLTYAGLAVSGNSTTALCKTSFDKVRVIPGNIRPTVIVTSPNAGRTPYVVPANINVTGLAYDLDGSLSKVDVYINDSIYYTAKTTTTINYELLTMKKAGSYKLYMKAYDNKGAVQTSDTVTFLITDPSPKLPYLKFDEKVGYTGLSTADANGNFYSGSLFNGPTFATGKVNNAIHLDGVDDYVKMSALFAIEKQSDITIATWVKLDSLTSYARIFDFGSGTNSYMFLSPCGVSGKIHFKIQSADGRSQEVTTSSVLPVGSWQHVVVTIGANKASIYLNGVLIGVTYPFKLRPYDLNSTTQTSYLGKSQFTADKYLKGYLDDMRFYNYGMTSTEIQNLYSTTSAVRDVEVDPISFYPNPARDKIVINNTGDSKLLIYSTVGALIREQELTSPNQTVDISYLSPGTYVLIISNSSGYVTRKVLIVK